MTKLELQELKELAEKATPGPWVCDSDYDIFSEVMHEGGSGNSFIVSMPYGHPDGPFIAASRTAIPKLIERIEELEREAKKPKLEVGDYEISYYHNDTYWIEHKSGEAMQVGVEFEKMIDAYYKAHF